MSLFNWLFGCNEKKEIIKGPEIKCEYSIDELTNKLYTIINIFGGETTIDGNCQSSTYKHKTLTIQRNCYWSIYTTLCSIGIYINDIHVFRNGKFNGEGSWSNDLSEECKQKVIKTIDKLYNDALEKQQQDEQDRLDKLKQGCSEL